MHDYQLEIVSDYRVSFVLEDGRQKVYNVTQGEMKLAKEAIASGDPFAIRDFIYGIY